MNSTGGHGRGRKHRAPSEASPPRPASGVSPGSPTPVPPVKTNKMTISSDYGEAREVQRLIREDIEQFGFDNDSQFAIKLSIEEAIINAIKHGNRLDEAKQVTIEFAFVPSRHPTELVVSVIDQGEGFEVEEVANPLAPENLLKSSGRGIFFMRSFMDDVQLLKVPEGGMEVRMMKKLQAAPDQPHASA